MAALPNLSGLRPAPAPTGPYAGVLRDESCPLSLHDFKPGTSMTLRGSHLVKGTFKGDTSSLRRAGAYRSHVGCDKAWQPLTYKRDGDGRSTDETILEPHYYDTIHLALWLEDHNTSPITKREFVEEDMNACKAKAAELAELQGWGSLVAYREAYVQGITSPPQALPAPPDSAAQRAADIADLVHIGKSTLDSLMHEPAAPLHYGKLLDLVHIDLGGHRRVFPLSASTPGAVELKQGLEQAGLGMNSGPGLTKYTAALWAAYEDYKTAHDIDIWANSVTLMGIRIMPPNQNWWDYWNHYQEREHSRPNRTWPTIGYLCEHEVGEAKQLLASLLLATERAPPLSKLEEAHHRGWTPKLLVARSVLTLWALLAMAPLLFGFIDPTTAAAHAFHVPMDTTFTTLRGDYAATTLVLDTIAALFRPVPSA